MATEDPSLVTVNESACRRFEAAWQESRPEPIEQFLPPEDHLGYLATLEELIHIELEFAWKSWWGQTAAKSTATMGRPVCVEAYLARFPRLSEAPVILRLLQQEYQVRHRYGDRPSTAEYSERFPSLVLTGREVQGDSREEAGRTAELPNIPGYQILGFLGRGGMGTVFKARQTNLNRMVALKIILAGSAASAKELARFHTEAEAVARLQHPHIVQIHDVGQHQGCPYLALEYGEGGTLAQKLAGAPQPARQAAQLVETLARAMHVAHQRGIVHRDLKPANVLLSSVLRRPSSVAEGQEATAPGYGPRTTDYGLPKITDFGLAKLLDSESGQTATGVPMGTPSYMAPEQATGKTQEIGPATDTYALGAILYEMLAGRPPFRGETPLSTMEQVRSREPLPPSQLHPKVPRDLETICLKCLEKQARKRYASAEELADDLARFLAGKPIRARPTPVWERSIKWMRRRPATAALLGIGGLAAVIVMAVIVAANARLKRERDFADEQRQEAQVQRQRALAHLRRACDAVDVMLSRIGFDRLAPVPHMETVRKQLLEDALRFYQELSREESSNPEVRMETGRAYWRLGKYQRFLGDYVKAEQSSRAAVALHEKLATDFPAEPVHRRDLAASFDELGRLQEGLGRYTEAEQALVQAISLQEKLVADSPDNVDYQEALANSKNHLGLVFQQTDRLPEAGLLYQVSVDGLEKLVAQTPSVDRYWESLLDANNNLAVFFTMNDQTSKAERAFRRDLEIWEQLLRRSPRLPRFRTGLARSTFNLGWLLLSQNGRPQEGETLIRRSIDVWRGLVEEYPTVSGYHQVLGSTLRKLAARVFDRQDVQAALELLQQSIEQQRISLKVNPSDAGQRSMLVASYKALAEMHLRTQDYEKAAQAAAEMPAIASDVCESWLDAARTLARCVPSVQRDTTRPADDRQNLAQRYADRAVGLLREAIRKGHTNIESLKEPDFEPLRSREDFKMLLQDLLEKIKSNDPPP